MAPEHRKLPIMKANIRQLITGRTATLIGQINPRGGRPPGFIAQLSEPTS